MTTTRVPIEKLSYPGDGLHYCEGKPFTGIAYFLATDGSVQAEEEYRDGLLWGSKKEWFRPGVLEREAECARGVRHGRFREWHENGRLAAEATYEYGIRTEGKRWDSEGNLIEDFHLEETDPAFETLKLSRDTFGGDGA